MAILEDLVPAFEDAVSFLSDTAGELVLRNAYDSGLLSNYTLLSMLFTFLREDTFQLNTIVPKAEYDYIVVGGGSAGAVMASRLSEKSCVSVLLLEAGGEPPILTEIPGFARLFQDSNIDWRYKIEPQKYAAFGHKENRITWNSGKVLGGTSTINSMMYVRGSKEGYNNWEKEGATGWNYEDVLPYFLKAEDNHNIDDVDEGYHNTSGPLSVENINYTPDIKTAILEASRALGYEQLDINGRRQTGVSKLQATFRDQKRCSTVKAYLDPARNRPNLDILTNAYVRKILIDQISTGISKSKSRANGVEYDYLGVTHTVRARKEVILSSGAVRTPQILMLSGIGPKDELERLHIPVVKDLPVGKNLQDHYGTHLIYKVNSERASIIFRNSNPINVGDYVVNRRGPLASAEQVLVGAFLNGRNTTKNSPDYPRQAVWFMEFDTLDAKLHFNLKDEVFEKVYAPHVFKPVILCFPTILRPSSRGEIKLNSTDPYDMPLINPNYYKNESDLMDVVEGMKICEEITKQPAMLELGVELIEEQRSGFPSCEQYEGDKDAYFKCIAKQVMNTIWHYSGTARMGLETDARSVVDPELRVIGVDGLRVVDASVMPYVPTGNTNAPTIMVAERVYGLMEGNITCPVGGLNL